MKFKPWFIFMALTAWCVTGMVSANNDVLERIKDDNQWVMPNKNYGVTRYSSLDQINNKNAQNLGLVWEYDTGVTRGHEGSPIVVHDVPMPDGSKKSIMYISTPFPNKIAAFDLDNLVVNGNKKVTEELWTYVPEQDKEETLKITCCDPVNRGLVYGDGYLYFAQLDGHLVKLDAATGKMVWTKNVFLEDPNNPNSQPLPKGKTITAAPMLAKDKVIIGMGGGEYGARGFIDAYNLDGKHIWRGYSMGPDEEMLVDPNRTTVLGKPIGAGTGITYDQSKNPNGSWGVISLEGVDPVSDQFVRKTINDQWKQGGGATWGFYSYDPELNLVYYGTGNPGTWNPALRPGENKWSCAVFARDLDTGMVKWVYQFTPNDEWDYDGNLEMFLIDKEINGKMHKLLVHFDRNGFAYTMDRETGMLLEAHRFDPIVNWADRIVTDPNHPKYGRPNVRDPRKSPDYDYSRGETTRNICPTAKGLRDVPPPAYSPKTDLFYFAKGRVCMNYKPTFIVYHEGLPYVGAEVDMYAYGASPEEPFKDPYGNIINRGVFTAYDNNTGQIVWEIEEFYQGWMGVLVTGGNVAFYGTMDGHFKAVDATREGGGKVLKDFKPTTEGGIIPSGIIGSVMTFMHNGKQYVAVQVGLGGWAGLAVSDPELSKPDTPGTAALGAIGLNQDLRKVWGTDPKNGTLMIFALEE